MIAINNMRARESFFEWNNSDRAMRNLANTRPIENPALRSYVEAMFPGRIPTVGRDIEIMFLLHDEEVGRTRFDIEIPVTSMYVYIPRKYWDARNTDNRLLIDCIDHELVHVEDIVSFRAFNYYRRFGKERAMNIMDYKAYHQNQWYNRHIRKTNIIDYSEYFNHYRNLIPKDWWKIK